MLVTPDMLEMTYTQSEIDELVNNLLLNAHGFSHIACLDGKGYGVSTLCDSCLVDVTWCVRKEIMPQLIAAQQLLEEKKLKYFITPRYVTEEIEWRGELKFQLKYPGLDTLLVKEEVQDITDDDTDTDPVVDVNPYIEQVTVIAGNFILVHQSLNPTPGKLLLTNDDNGQNVLIDEDVAPMRFTDEGVKYWKIKVAAEVDTVINVFNCDFIIVEFPIITVENGSVFPVYTGTNQKIPMAKEPVELDDTVLYTFHPYVLLDIAFYEDGADFGRREFYKLFETIQFKKFVEVEAKIVVEYYTCSCTPCPTTTTAETDKIAVKIEKADRGIISIDACNFKLCNCNLIKKITIKYKTDPELYKPGASTTLKEAIAHKVAAELPISTCNCKVIPNRDWQPIEDYRGTFIYMAQKAYTQVRINPYTGEMIENFKHGNLYGQVVFAEKLNELSKFKRSVRA